MNQPNSQNRIILGAVIVFLGILALIDNMQIFASMHVLTFWPTVFIIVGLVKLLQAKQRSNYIYGALFLALGLFLTLENLGLFDFDIEDLWPLFLIGAGIMVLTKKSREDDSRRRTDHLHAQSNHDPEVRNDNFTPNNFTTPSDNLAPGGIAPTHLNLASVLSGSTRRCDAQNFRGGDLTTILGGSELDLRQASIQGEATLNIFAMWGGIVLLVPPDWTVINDAIPVLGGAEDRTVSPPMINKRLIITGMVIMGGLEIKN